MLVCLAGIFIVAFVRLPAQHFLAVDDVETLLSLCHALAIQIVDDIGRLFLMGDIGNTRCLLDKNGIGRRLAHVTTIDDDLVLLSVVLRYYLLFYQSSVAVSNSLDVIGIRL